MFSYLRQTHLEVLSYWFTLRVRNYRLNYQPRMQKGIKLELLGLMRLKIKICDKELYESC